MAKSFIQKLFKQWRETEELNPKKPSGGKNLKLSPAQIILVGDWVNEKNDITLKEISRRLEEQEGITVSISTVCRTLQSLNLSKKNNTDK